MNKWEQIDALGKGVLFQARRCRDPPSMNYVKRNGSASLITLQNSVRSVQRFLRYGKTVHACAIGWATFDFLSQILADTGFPHAFKHAEFNGAN